jgi:hypothetical protein
MTPERLAAFLVIAGMAVAIVGVALVYIPAAVIAGGVCLAALGLDERRRA